MPKLSPDPLPTSRYPDKTVGLEIKRCIEARAALKGVRGYGRGYHTRVAAHLGWTSQQLTHRLGGDYRLTTEMVGCIAEYMDAPPGWPFLSWEVARAALGGSALIPHSR